MNQTRFLLILIICIFSSKATAQNTVALQNFENHFEERLTEIHFKILKAVVEEKITIYSNDSLNTPLSNDDLSDRFDSLPIHNGILSSQYKLENRNPGILFIYKEVLSFETNSFHIQLQGVSAMSPWYLNGRKMGLATTGRIKIDDLSQLLNKDDLQFLMAMQMVVRSKDIYQRKGWDNPKQKAETQLRRYYSDKRPHVLLDTSSIDFLCQSLSKSFPYVFDNYYKHKTWQMRPLFQDSLLSKILPINSDGYHFHTKQIIQVGNPENPNDPYDMIDTVVTLPLNFKTTDLKFEHLSVQGVDIIKGSFYTSWKKKEQESFYIPLETMKFMLKRWDYILLMDFIRHNTEK